MYELRTHIQRYCSQSKPYRLALIIAFTFGVFRLFMQLMLLSGTIEDTPALPDDLRIYMEAATHLQQQVNLYPSLPLEEIAFYQYAPSYALAFRPFLWLPGTLTALLLTFLHLAAYALLYLSWRRIFRKLSLQRAEDMLIWTLPLWLVFGAFWTDLSFLNVYIIMALLATLLIEAILSENLGWAVVWVSVILQMKPQWAFALVLPLLLGKHRFFFKLILSTIAAYAAVASFTIIAAGPTYGLEQYVAYFRLLPNISANFPWHTPGMPFLGYNHSIAQVIIYLFGKSAESFQLALVLKALILLPLAVLALRFVMRTPQVSSPAVLKLDLAFALYTSAFIWLDVMWELSLAIAVFTYLLATTKERNRRVLIWIVFLPYALTDAWQFVSFMIFGPSIIIPGPMILTDFSIYVPLTMILTVVFYGLLVTRLWTASAVVQPAMEQIKLAGSTR